MANGPRNIESKDYNNKPVIKGNKKIWFLNGDLVRFHHSSRSTGMVTVYNITQDRLETCLRSDFRKNRQRAFSVSETAQIVNRHRKYFPSLVKRGIIPAPMGSQPGGKSEWQVRAYYSESQVKEIRDILASYHMGRPRKDKIITNSITPTRQELTRRIGDGILTYTKTEDGRFIPVWSEKI
jgi:type III secretory pathway component EscV